VAIVYNRAQIISALQPSNVIAAVEQAFAAYSRGEAIVPPIGEPLFEQPPWDCHIKYGYLKTSTRFTVKIATGFWQNPERGLPSSNGVVLVFSRETGELLCILQDEGYLTDIRTAAAGAIAAYLAPAKIDFIGIVGAGTQARLQLEYLRHAPAVASFFGRAPWNGRRQCKFQAFKLIWPLRLPTSPHLAGSS
jgi:ornithine cyclodeaminase